MFSSTYNNLGFYNPFYMLFKLQRPAKKRSCLSIWQGVFYTCYHCTVIMSFVTFPSAPVWISDWEAVHVVLSQLVCRRVGGVQSELWRRGADAAGPVCPENQPDQRRHRGRLSLCPGPSGHEASLQHTQLSTALDHRAMVTGKRVWKSSTTSCENLRLS